MRLIVSVLIMVPAAHVMYSSREDALELTEDMSLEGQQCPSNPQEVNDRHFRPFALNNPFRRLIWPPRRLVSKYVRRGMIVADLGCGSGYHTLPIAEIVGREGKVYAVDSDERAVRALRSSIAAHGFTNVEAESSSAAELPFIPSGSVDFVFANGLLCCMADHDGAVGEVKRVLKPEGTAYISITKLAREKDPRTVRREEWQSLLSDFDLVKVGEGLTQLWAYARKKRSDSKTGRF